MTNDPACGNEGPGALAAEGADAAGDVQALDPEGQRVQIPRTVTFLANELPQMMSQDTIDGVDFATSQGATQWFQWFLGAASV